MIYIYKSTSIVADITLYSRIVIIIMLFISTLLTLAWIATFSPWFVSAVPLRQIVSHPEEMETLFEGDIILPNYHKGRNLVMDRKYLWPNKTLTYELSDEFQPMEKKWIELAIHSLQNETCVRFKKRTFEQDYVYVRNKNGCAAVVGFNPGRVEMYLNLPGCIKWGTIQHEFLHALGFWHEHTRYDRDQYVSIQWKNIMKGLEINFAARRPQESQFEGLPYDFGSVMHYRETAFSRDSLLPTIIPRMENVSIGQRDKFSRVDLAKLNRLYDCDDEYYKGDDLVESTTENLVTTTEQYQDFDTENSETGSFSLSSTDIHETTQRIPLKLKQNKKGEKLRVNNKKIKHENESYLNKFINLIRKKRYDYFSRVDNTMKERPTNMRPILPPIPHYWHNPSPNQQPEHRHIIICPCQGHNQYEFQTFQSICSTRPHEEAHNRRNHPNSDWRPRHHGREHKYNERTELIESHTNNTEMDSGDFESNTSNKTSAESYDYYNIDLADESNMTQYGTHVKRENKNTRK